MHKRFKLLFIAASFLMVALMGASTAQASRGVTLSTTTIGASGVLTLNGVLTCDVLLSLTVNSRTLSKTTGINQGTANGGFIRNCRGSLAGNPPTGQILGPINVQYASFEGNLPVITKINVVAPNAAFSVNAALVGNCLYSGNLTGVGITVSGGAATGVAFDSNTLTRTSGSALCPSTGTIRGTLGTLLNPVTLTLV